jgi:hypothetical protein
MLHGSTFIQHLRFLAEDAGCYSGKIFSYGTQFFRVQWVKTNLSVQPPKVRWHTITMPVFSFSETDFTYEGHKKKVFYHSMKNIKIKLIDLYSVE